MKTVKTIKNENLKNLFVQGLLMAAIVTSAVAAVDPVWADNLATAVGNTKTNALGPILTAVNYGCYVAGAIIGLGGILKLKAHAENAGQNPLSHGLARCGVGAALLALPSIVGVLSATGTSSLGSQSSSFGSWTPN